MHHFLLLGISIQILLALLFIILRFLPLAHPMSFWFFFFNFDRNFFLIAFYVLLKYNTSHVILNTFHSFRENIHLLIMIVDLILITCQHASLKPLSIFYVLGWAFGCFIVTAETEIFSGLGALGLNIAVFVAHPLL